MGKSKELATIQDDGLTVDNGNGNFVYLGNDGAIEIRRSGGGGYIDFHGSAVDYDVRIQHHNNGLAFNVGGDGNQITGATIDASGRVTMPYQPSFNVYQSTSFNAVSGVWTQNLNLDTARHNVGNHFNTSNSSFTAPISGRYFLSYTTHFNSSTTNYFYSGLKINGSFETYLFGYNAAVSGVDNTFGGSIILHMNANDVVTFWNYDGDGGTIGAGFQRTNASGHLLG